MNWLAKINIKTLIDKLGPFRSALFFVVLIGLSLFVGYRLGNFFHGFQVEKIATQQQQLEQLHEKYEAHERRINTLDVELEMERLANEQALNVIKTLEEQHYQVKEQLAFYQKVMAPEKQADGIVLDRLIIAEAESERHFRFQVVLLQQAKNKRYAKGYVDFKIIGSLNGKPKTLKLSDVSSLDRKAMSFSFQYFEAIDGDITLPEGFIPEQIVTNTTLPKGRWQKHYQLEETYTWTDVLILKE